MNEWLLDFSKIQDDEDWLMKLLSTNKSSLALLSDKQASVINTFLLTNNFYKEISSNEVDIKSLLDEDPLIVVKNLVTLRKKLTDDTLYIDEFKNELNKDAIIRFITMGKINSEAFLFNNVIVDNTTNLIILNKKIKDEINKSSEFTNLSDELKNALIESTKSSMGWKRVDYKKHAMGSLVDFIDLSLSLLQFNTTYSESKRIHGIQYLANIFQPYFNIGEDNMVDILKNSFYTQYEFEIPYWKGKVDKIDKNKISNFSNEDEKDNSFLYKLHNYFNEYETMKMSGVSESIVILLYNIFSNTIIRLKYLYQELYNRINKTNKIETEKEKGVLKLSIKNSIEILEHNYKTVIRTFFDINDDINEYGVEQTNDDNLYPTQILKNSKSKSSFRVLGGIKSIKKKEKCDKNNFPIVLKYDEHDDFKGEINLEETRERLINMFINSDVYVGGLVLHKNIAPKTFNVIEKFLVKGLRSKHTSMKKIDNEFKKMIKGIKLNKVSVIANKLQSNYKKIILQSNNTVRNTVSKQIIDDIIVEYKNYKETELVKTKDFLEVLTTIKKYKNKELNKTQKEKIAKLTTINKKLLTEYFIIKNTSYVYKLLAINILKALINFYNNKSSRLKSSYLSNLEKGIQDVDTNFESKKKVFNTKNLNNLEHSMKNKNINLNMSGGNINFIKPVNRQIVDTKRRVRPLNQLKLNKPPKEIEEISYSDFWKDLEYKKMSGKSIFVPYYNSNSIVSNKTGFFNILDTAQEGKPVDTLSFNSSSIIDKIRHQGLIIICDNTSELTKPGEWRLLSKKFLQGLNKKSPGTIRKEMYNCVASRSDYLKNSVIWGRNILMEQKILLTNVCKVYGDSMLDCDLIISREELMKHLGFNHPAK